MCLDLLTNPRNWADKAAARKARRQYKEGRKCPGGVDNSDPQGGVNVQLHSERLSDLHSISKSVPSERSVENKPRDLAKEKRLSEGLQALKAELSRSPDPLLNRRD
jgi:hypothetical protein